MLIKTDGIVLRSYNLQEDDRSIVILSKEYGLIRAYAKGDKRFKSRTAAATEVLSYSSFLLYYGKDKYSLNSAEQRQIFFGLRQDIEKLSLGLYFAQLMKEVAPYDEPAPLHLRLLLNCLYFLETGKRDSDFLKPLFELRVLSMAGFMPNLVACRECGAYLSEPMYFSTQHGDLLCAACYEKAQDKTMIPLSGDELTAMRYIIYSDFEKLFGFSLSKDKLKRLGKVIEKYVLYQTDRTYSTLEYLKSL